MLPTGSKNTPAYTAKPNSIEVREQPKELNADQHSAIQIIMDFYYDEEPGESEHIIQQIKNDPAFATQFVDRHVVKKQA